MSPASSGSSPAFARLTLDERSLVRLVLEFLESRGLHISQIALERESGLINGRFSEDLLFLRQLIIDGQWDNALDFVEPLRRLGSVFDYTKFKFTILKHKYYELLCIKLEPGPLHDNDLAVEEVVACLKSLETASPSAEEYKRLCALLTLYRFSEHADFAHWNPSAARMECFQKIRPLVEPHMPPNAADPNLHNSAASPDRLVALLAKGLFYEAAVDYCQAQALGDKQTITRFSSGTPFGAVLDERRGTLGDPDLSLIGWLAVVSCEQFVTPFQQLRLDLQLDALKKPRLDAQWTESILAAPIRPRGAFPHSHVPQTNQLADNIKMSQSLAALPRSMIESALFTSTRRRLSQAAVATVPHAAARPQPSPMSSSMGAGFCLLMRDETSQNDSSTAMQQSVLIDTLLETSQHAQTTRPRQQQQPVAQPAMPPPSSLDFGPMAATISRDSGPDSARRQLHEIAQRSLIYSTTLPPVAELPTPTTGMPPPSSSQHPAPALEQYQSPEMARSLLFHEFATRQTQQQQQFTATRAPPVTYYPPPQQPMHVLTTQQQQQQQQQPPPQVQQPQPSPNMVPSLSSQGFRQTLQFVPVCTYEDSQAIRAAAFHPSGRLFAIGTNSKQLHVCRYPDVKKAVAVSAGHPLSAELLVSRPKQHRGSVYCLAWSPTGDLLATGSNDKSIRLMGFDAVSCRPGAELELNCHDGTVRDLIFAGESRLISAGAGTCHICVSDAQRGQLVSTMSEHTAPILGLYSWSPHLFVSGSQDKTVRFWDVRVARSVGVMTPDLLTAGRTTSSSSPVTSVCVEPSGRLLAAGHEDASVCLWDINGGRALQSFRPHADEVRSVRFSNAAYYLLSASYDRRVVITDMRGDLTSALTYIPVAEHADKVIQCRWHPHEFTFLSTSADKRALLWALPPPPPQNA